MGAAAVTRTRSAIAVPAFAVPAGLYVVALAVRLCAMVAVSFPLTEGSAYYVAVAHNIATGRGLVIDAIWSYATPPLTLPRAAFELWQPMASLIAALPMAVFGPTFASAQVGYALLGALLAPLAWLVARDAAQRLDLPDHRARYVALGAGVLTAVTGPFVLSTAIPDSALPFTVLAVAACLVMPAAVRGNSRALVALGVLLGLAYLTRMEAIYLGVVFVAIAWSAAVFRRDFLVRVGAITVIGALVALPWWLRNLAVFGTPMPGQLADNAFLTSNLQIFAWADRPTLAGFLAQGPLTIAANIGDAGWHNFVDVLLIPGSVIVTAGLLAIAIGWRRRRDLDGSPLLALLWFGALAFLITSVFFPVATLWGTFEHAAGPLLVAFAVLSVLGGDAFVARVREWRHWPRPNAGMAPAALAGLALAITVLQVASAGTQAHARQQQVAAAASYVRTYLTVDPSAPVITDHPVWMSDALGVPALALPDEGSASVLDLARTFGAHAVVILDLNDRLANRLSGPCSTDLSAPGLHYVKHGYFMPGKTIAEACR